MKIKDIYEESSSLIKTKDPQYKKLAILNYVILASLIFINLLFNLLLLVPNDIFKSIVLIIVIINNYLVNVVLSIILIVNAIIQGIIAKNNKHTILSYLCMAIGIIITLTLILLQ